MDWLKNTNIGQRLVLGFATMIVLVSVVGFQGVWTARTLEARVEAFSEERLPALSFLLEADRDLQQLLVAERSVIFAKPGEPVFVDLVKAYDENKEQAWRRWGKYKELASTDEEQRIIAAFEQAWKNWEGVSRRVVDGRVADTRAGRREALDLTLGESNALFEAMRDQIDKLTEINQNHAKSDREAAGVGYRNAKIFGFGMIAVGVVLGTLIMLVLRSSITGPLRSVIKHLTESSQKMASASTEIAAASNTLADGASAQAAAIEQTSASLEEMSTVTESNAQGSQETDQLMKEATQLVETANAGMERLQASMQEINDASGETQAIIKTIDEIAFQTNLLALNAAVEAARAGDAGKGFAVVAEEVRNLAQRSAEAASNTAGLIERTVERTRAGTSIVAETNTSFVSVSENVERASQLVSEIAMASQDQAKGISQINRAASEMDRVTQTNAANSEETAGSAEQMRVQATQLLDLVDDLKVLVGWSGAQSAQRAMSVSAPRAIRKPAPAPKSQRNKPSRDKVETLDYETDIMDLEADMIDL